MFDSLCHSSPNACFLRKPTKCPTLRTFDLICGCQGAAIKCGRLTEPPKDTGVWWFRLLEPRHETVYVCVTVSDSVKTVLMYNGGHSRRIIANLSLLQHTLPVSVMCWRHSLKQMNYRSTSTVRSGLKDTATGQVCFWYHEYICFYILKFTFLFYSSYVPRKGRLTKHMFFVGSLCPPWSTLAANIFSSHISKL